MTTSITTQKLAALVDRLCVRAQTAGQGWHETVSPGRFGTTLKNHVITIEQDDEDYILTLVDRHENVLERVSDADLHEADSGIYGKMAILFQEARRSALHIEEVLDDILDDI